MALAEQISALRYAVRLRIVAKYLGQLATVLAALTCMPLVVALLFGEYHLALRYAVVVIGLAAVGIPIGRRGTVTSLQFNEGLVITALTFVLSPLVMSFPMTGAGLHFSDALFEAISGVTTTGLTTLSHVQEMPRSFLFARAWMQWYGGLGIVVLSLAALVGPGGVAKRLASVEGDTDDIASNTRRYAQHAIVVYSVLTVAAVAVLWALSGDFFNALLQGLTAVSTGGFSTFDQSIAGFANPAVPVAVMLFCLLGAAPLLLYYQAYQRGWGALLANAQWRVLLFLVVAAAVLTILLMLLDGRLAPGASVYHGALLALSAQTGAGFSTVDVDALSDPTKLSLMVFMLIGGGVGSTTGGIKVLRLIIIAKLVWLIVQRAGMPTHAVAEPRLGRERLDNTDIERAFVLLTLFVATVTVSWLPFLLFGHDPLNSLFEVVSATATVGLSTGVTGPELHPLLKGVLCLDMLLGRLEMIAFLVLLAPGTWFGNRGEA